MATSTGVAPPPKPWERGQSGGPSPFRPSSSPAGVANSDETKIGMSIAQPAPTTTNIGRPMPPRPWERNPSAVNRPLTNYSQYPNYSGGYGSGIGSYGNSFGTGMYGNNYGTGGMYGSGHGTGGIYGSGYGTGGMYGSGYGTGGMYGSGYGMAGTYGGIGNYGMGPGSLLGYGEGDPNNPFGGGVPAAPPSFWQSLLRVMHGVVNFFGRVSLLVDQNTQAFHFFISALLQLCDRSGLLYGELARFVFRLFGFRSSQRLQNNKIVAGAMPGHNGPLVEPRDSNGAWDNVWSQDSLYQQGE